jgi:hypothetical protein
VRRSGRPRAGDALTHIGHPDRLATKVDLAGTLVGNLGSPPSVFPQVVNLHAIIGSSGSMVYNRSERFVETVTRSPMGASFAFDPANNCRRLTHSDQPGLPNVSVAHFARNIPPFELLVSPLDTVVHVGPVGGPFTNPVTTRTVRVDGTSPAPVGYRVETAVVGDPGPQLLVSTEVTPVGTLAPGGSFSVFETIDAATAPCGVYERTYKVIDTTHGFTDVVRHRFEIGLNHCSLASAGRSGRE